VSHFYPSSIVASETRAYPSEAYFTHFHVGLSLSILQRCAGVKKRQNALANFLFVASKCFIRSALNEMLPVEEKRGISKEPVGRGI
jgi:hypothetical protein